MALGKAIFAEPLDRLIKALAELARDASLREPLEQPRTVPLEPSVAAPRGHVAPELIGLAARIAGPDDRELHHLLLEERHAESPLEDRREHRVRDGHRLFPGPPPQVRVHHAPLDRSRANDRHLDDQVVEAPRPKARQHRHLRAALDLEDADRVGRAERVVNVRVLRGDGGQPIDGALFLKIHRKTGRREGF